MSIGTACIANVQTGGSDTNGGIFNAAGSSPGTDYSTQTSPQVVIDGVTITASVHTTTTQINVVGVSVTAALNRNGLQITGGTATAGVYEITAVDTVNNRLTLDRAPGTSTQTVIGNIGGCWATPGKGNGVLTNVGQKTYIKSGTYTVGAQIVGAGRIEGYSTVPGDLAATPLFQANANSIIVFSGGSGTTSLHNIKVDGNSKTSVTAFGTVRGPQTRCVASNCATGFSNANGVCYRCFALSCTTGFSTSATWSVAKSCGTGASPGNGNNYFYCFAISCTTAGFSAANGIFIGNCVAYSCQIGFSFIRSQVMNCIASNSTGKGFTSTEATSVLPFLTNADFSPGTTSDFSPIILSASPFVNPTATINTVDDAIAAFTLNTTAGGGVACRRAGTEPYVDIGASQQLPAPIAYGF